MNTKINLEIKPKESLLRFTDPEMEKLYQVYKARLACDLMIEAYGMEKFISEACANKKII